MNQNQHLKKLKSKIVSLEFLIEKSKELQSNGGKIVFTNGCFDILHKGHVTYLALAADLGDIMVLGLNSDDSVRRQGKGEDRPVNEFTSRATVMAALGFIDYVVEFDQDTPIEIIQNILPNVLVKGGDYDPEETDKTSKKYIVGRKEVLANGGEVQTIDLIDGFSTTGIINKLKK